MGKLLTCEGNYPLHLAKENCQVFWQSGDAENGGILIGEGKVLFIPAAARYRALFDVEPSHITK